MTGTSMHEGTIRPTPIPMPPPTIDILQAAIGVLRELGNNVQEGIATLQRLATSGPLPMPPVPDPPAPRGPVMPFVDVHHGMMLRPINGNGGGDPDPDPRPRPHPTPPPVPSPAPAPALGPADVTVGANGWGIVFTLSHNAAQSLANGTAVVSGLVGAAAAAFPPAAIPAGIVAGFLAANAAWIMLVDHGNGVYLTLPWLLPGVVIPGPR